MKNIEEKKKKIMTKIMKGWLNSGKVGLKISQYKKFTNLNSFGDIRKKLIDF